MKKKFILKTSILATISAILIFVYIYGFKYLDKKSQKIADFQASVDAEITKTQQSFDIKKQTDTVNSISETIESHFLRSSEVPLFLSSIEEIGTKTGSSIIISAVEETSLAEVGPVLSLNIGASGSYQSIYKTLITIENLPYFLQVNSVSISSDQTLNSGTNKNEWSLNLNLVIKSYIK